MIGDKISWQGITSVSRVQSMQLGSDLMVSENPAVEKYWRSLSEALNVGGKSDSSVARGMMSGSLSQAFECLVWSDVELDESGLDDRGTRAHS